MAKNKKRYVKFKYHHKKIKLLLDKVLIFRFIRNLHGRFWGIASMLALLASFSVCFIIRPDLFKINTALSDFGTDVRTAPYFAGAVFFAAYGMWRWRNYLSRTWKRSRPLISLIGLTVIGLYLIALMPVAWHGWPERFHIFGVMLAGLSMLATVVLDAVLTKPSSGRNRNNWRFVRFISVILIVSGGWLTYGSARLVGWYSVALLGESLLLAGYLLWIVLKTYLGEGNRSELSKILHKIVLVD